MEKWIHSGPKSLSRCVSTRRNDVWCCQRMHLVILSMMRCQDFTYLE